MDRRAWTLFAPHALLGIALATSAAQAGAATPAEQLRDAILQAAAEGVSNPVQATIERLRISDGVALTLSLDAESNPLPTRFSEMVKPANVPGDDWQALIEMPLNPDDLWSEFRQVEFVLIDLDGDGRLDLVREHYVGGTGLFSQISLIRQDPASGFSLIDNKAIEEGRSSPGQITYEINGRGGDQAIDLLRIDGRVLAVYRDSTYGVDTLSVDVPFSASMPSQSLQVRYAMAHTAHAAQDPSRPTDVDAALLKAVNRQLRRHAWQPTPDPDAQVCPSPTDSDNPWPWHGAGHYSFEYAWSFPVRYRNQCLSAAVVNFLSSYHSEAGESCALWLFDHTGEQVGNLDLSTQRRVIAIDMLAVTADGE